MASKSISYSLQPALDPAASVFVSANAGAGKTSLLTNRVLSLLVHGVEPSKILCLTFTNAAAAEMANRVQKELGAWVMADEEKLRHSLGFLIGRVPDQHALKRARSLFAKVLELPEGIRIQTIHGFSQSLLRRFPIEAGISPHFTVMDGRTEQELLQEARLRLFSRAQTEDPRLQEALHAIAHALGESAFQSLIAEIIQHKRKIRSLFSKKEGIADAVDTLYRVLRIPRASSHTSLIEKHFAYTDETLSVLRRITKELLTSEAPTDQTTGNGLAHWLEKQASGIDRSSRDIAEYVEVFVTDKGDKRKRLFTKQALTNPDLIAALSDEQERVWRYSDAFTSLEMAQNSQHVIHVAQALLELYRQLKEYHALMDYDDLILTACDLLQRPGISPWVLFKLDGGIDHILVDEAQDTSPEQWTIITALTQEFFAGKGKSEKERSLFVVGDEKQSIYSFQGADPTALGRMQHYFSQKIRDAAKLMHCVELNKSYRSTQEVLASVDAVFAQPAVRQGLTFDDKSLTHIATRLDHAGLVELWPLAEPQEGEGGINLSPVTILARRIAETLSQWIDNGVMLESKGRPINAGDVMILVRSRTSLVDRLVRALKKYNVPVAGHDRMALSDNLAVQDLMALGQCLLLPEDSLSLAAVLKSPIFNLSEEQLFTLAYGREKQNLWERLRDLSVHNTTYKVAFDLMTDLRARTDFSSPFELYSYVLDTVGARRRFTGRMGDEYNDPIDEFLGQALLYERSHAASLQGFLHWLDASDSEIKRDMEQAKGCVRIMTIHGAKGLQAPIVILPDTTELPKQQNTLQWYYDENFAIPLWSRSSGRNHSLSSGLREQQKQLMLSEYRRLLYVALTRAEDRLYICGSTSKESVNEQCWYHLVKQGITPLATPFTSAWGEGLRVGAPPLGDIDKPLEEKLASAAPETDFSFLHRQVPAEQNPPQPLVPSRLEGKEPATLSPLSSGMLFQRGVFIHRLLQYLPDVASSERQRIATAMAEKYRKSLSEVDLEVCIAEVLTITEQPEFSFMFSQGSLAEVPVAGSLEIDGQVVSVSGQIDRLCIGEEEVWVVDFKSNRIHTGSNASVPPVYLRQMRLYSLLMKKIYQNKTIRCAIVWTSAPMITVIEQSLLDETPVSSYI